MGTILHKGAGEGLFDHKGYVARILDDGSTTSSWTDETERRTIGWRPQCACGWAGQSYDSAAPDQSIQDREDQLMAEWTDKHARRLLAELELASDLGGLARQADEAAANLRHGVRCSRDAGASWEQIGRALGVSRQAAWERFASASQPKVVPSRWRATGVVRQLDGTPAPV